MADPAPAWDRAARAAWAVDLRAARSRLAEAGTALARDRRFDDVLAAERAVGQLARLIDRVEIGGQSFGRWVSVRGATAPAELVWLDRVVADATVELLRTVETLASAWGGARLAAVEELLREIDRALATRRSALAADEPPVLPAPTLAEAWPGDKVTVEGREYLVVERTRWRRGDASLALTDAALRLELWQDLAGDLVLFEGVSWDVPPVAQTSLRMDGIDYSLRWQDDDGGAITSMAGRSWRTGPRWLYASGDGVLVWLEQSGGPVRVGRGLPVPAGDYDWSRRKP